MSNFLLIDIFWQSPTPSVKLGENTGMITKFLYVFKNPFKNIPNLQKKNQDPETNLFITLLVLDEISFLPSFFNRETQCNKVKPEQNRIKPEIFFAILLTKILIDNRKGVFYLYQKRKRQKITNNRGTFLSRK